MIELATLIKYFDDAEDASHEAREVSERCRDFYDGEQLTAAEKETLNTRNQPQVVFNLVQPKVDFLLGQERETRTDPKAFPRTPDHDEAADAATDAIRYVLDNNNFEVVASDVFEKIIIEGTGGCSVEVKAVGDKIEVDIQDLRWDRLFIDPHSMRRDATDALYIGYISWKDIEEVKLRWPDASEQITDEMSLHHSKSDTHDDKPNRWFSNKRNRVLCVDICFMHEGDWHNAMYAKGAFLEKPTKSVYVDSDGVPQCKFIISSAKVDRDGQRYGYVKQNLDPQKEVNARRSKSLHMLNVHQTFAREGAIRDIDAFKKEANKPDGHLTYPGAGEFGKDFGVIPNTGLVKAQFDMYLEAKQSMDMSSAKAALQGAISKGVSGRAVRSLLQGVMMENVPLFDVLSQWKKMVYRAVWDRIKQFWREERWMRVTDSEENLQWVGLNIPMTVGEQGLMKETGLKLSEVREQFGPELQQLYQQRPEMAQVAIKNAVAEIDVDIILEEVPDVTNLQSEQFELLVQMFQAMPFGPDNPDGIKAKDVIAMSTLRNKKRILGDDLTPQEIAERKEEQEAQAEAQQIQRLSIETDIQAKAAKTQLDTVNAEAQDIENQVAVATIENIVIDKRSDTVKKIGEANQAQSKAVQTEVETNLLLTEPKPDTVAIV